MVLESRHLIGLFLLMVVISGVVFTLGYVLGRSQYDAQVRAAIAPHKGTTRAEGDPAAAGATTAPAAQPTAPGGIPAPADWDFYRAAGPSKSEERLEKPGKPVEGASRSPGASRPSATAASAKGKGLLNSPLVPHGSFVLQVAALTRENDALALAEALQQKKFPAFVLTPAADPYYRVQVGPYADAQSANLAQRALEHEGFKAIVRH